MAPRQRMPTPPLLADELSVVTTAAALESHTNNSSSSNSSSSSGIGSKTWTFQQPRLGPPPTAAEVEQARERHDVFNLVALMLVVMATLLNWDLPKLATAPAQAWVGNYFYLNWATTVCYFLIDLIWVARVPICVKSPDVIIKHHFVAIAYLSGPLAWPEYRWFMGACLTVEINTWFLILRRVLYKRQDVFAPVIMRLVSLLFYISWIVIRVGIYPGIMYIFCRMARDEIVKTQIWFHWPMIFMPVHFFLCVLNLKWTYDLFQPIVSKLLSADDRKSTTTSISKGL